MKKGEQIENPKFWVNILNIIFAATKIYISIFNLTHFLISLMDSFHFPQWKTFFPIGWQILKISGNGISQSFILSLKCDHPLLCEFSILFSTVKLKLGHKFSQLINRFNIGILRFWSRYISKFFPIHKRNGKLGFSKSLDCIPHFSPIHWKVWKLRFLSPCLRIWSNGEAEGGISVQWHVASKRIQFMIKLVVFKNKC